jgi:hypothetical protein
MCGRSLLNQASECASDALRCALPVLGDVIRVPTELRHQERREASVFGAVECYAPGEVTGTIRPPIVVRRFRAIRRDSVVPATSRSGATAFEWPATARLNHRGAVC